MSIRRTDMRTRFAWNKQAKLFLLLNYKCAFSTVANALAHAEGWNNEILFQEQFSAANQAGFFDDHRILLVTRDPLDRLISFYRNWFVDKDADFTGPNDPVNRHFVNLRERAGKEASDPFFTASRNERGSRPFFDAWLDWLPSMWPMDEHLWPQHLIYSTASLELERIERFDVRSLEKVAAITELDLSVTLNRSRGGAPDDLRSEHAKMIAMIVYRRDYQDLNYSLGSAL